MSRWGRVGCLLSVVAVLSLTSCSSDSKNSVVAPTATQDTSVAASPTEVDTVAPTVSLEAAAAANISAQVATLDFAGYSRLLVEQCPLFAGELPPELAASYPGGFDEGGVLSPADAEEGATVSCVDEGATTNNYFYVTERLPGHGCWPESENASDHGVEVQAAGGLYYPDWGTWCGQYLVVSGSLGGGGTTVDEKVASLTSMLPQVFDAAATFVLDPTLTYVGS